MAKRKKLKLKKWVYFAIIGILLLGIAAYYGNEYYKDYLYKQTLEYKIITHGYTKEQSDTFQQLLSEEEINLIMEKEKDDTILSLIQEKYFLFKNLDDYLDYIKEEEYEGELSDVIALVNTHANHKWYTLELKTDLSLKEQMIVNKFYTIDQTYIPENLTTISLSHSYGREGDNKLIDYAYEKFLELWEAAKEQGYYLMVTSSYRTYQEQKEIYNSRKNSQGEKKADQTAARPGHSEHQTGLVVDMTSKSEPYADDFSQSNAYNWLKENAYKYGWIERYPENKTYLTGYSPESWHWRYVGIKAAQIIHDEDITYDEYYAYYIEK